MKAVEGLVGKLIQDGAIEEEDREIYEYGFYQGIVMLINIICTVTIGIVMKMVWEVLMFMFAYIPLRTFAGGFHAKTQARCFVYSNLLVVLILLGVRYLENSVVAFLVLGVIGGIVLVLLAPVEDKNKPLDERECQIYGKKAKRILMVDILVAGVLQVVGFQNLVCTIMVGIFALGVFLVMGYVKNILIDRKEQAQ